MRAIRAIQKIGTSLGSISKNPNVLPYRSAYISSKMRAAYVTRQHISVSLYDRLSTRPFLQAIEKKWIAFQLLKALEQCEAADAFHGDIKAENILVTSWNWIFLTDFAPFKPYYVPDSDPSPIYYYFSCDDRMRCGIAPERFTSSSPRQREQRESAALQSTPDTRADVFSMGCVIAEIFLDGEPLFDLVSLLKYRLGDPDVVAETLAKLKSIGDDSVADLVVDMIKCNPAERPSATECLARYTSSRGEEEKRNVFPLYFSSFLFNFFASILQLRAPDVRVRHICDNFAKIVQHIAPGTDCSDAEVWLRNHTDGHSW